MRSETNSAVVQALEEFKRALGRAVQEERTAAARKKDWIDRDVLSEIHRYEADVDWHMSVGEQIDRDDIRYAVRAELGRRFDTANLQLSDADPEAWYERGDESWQPEEPEVISDRSIHINALAKERARKQAMFEPSSLRRNAWPRKTYNEAQIDYLAEGVE